MTANTIEIANQAALSFAAYADLFKGIEDYVRDSVRIVSNDDFRRAA
jgi:hypothetical protein